MRSVGTNLIGRHDFDRVVLDDRVGEQLLAHRLDLLAAARRIGFGQLELDQLALAHLADPDKTECCQRIADRLALGSIRGPPAWRNQNPRLSSAMIRLKVR